MNASNASNATFRHSIENGDKIYIVCASSSYCSHLSVMDLQAMAARYGLDHGSLHADLVKLPWRCEKCGGHKVTFRYQPGKHEYKYSTPSEIPASKRKPDGKFWTHEE